MTYVSTVLADGAVGFWELADPSGTATTDASGNQNGVYNAAYTLGATGIVGGAGATAASFTTGYVGVIDNVNQRQGDTFSIEFWLKLGTASAKYGLMGQQLSTTGHTQIWIDATGHIVLASQGATIIVTATVAISDTTTWHHVVVAKNAGTSCKIFLDGVDVSGAVTNQTISAPSTGWYIAADGSGDTHVVGSMAMVALYPTALSSGAVSTHYTLGSSTGSGGKSHSIAPSLAKSIAPSIAPTIS